MERYQAVGAAGIVLDIYSGEVLAMSSIPDYDPNQPAQALDRTGSIVLPQVFMNSDRCSRR